MNVVAATITITLDFPNVGEGGEINGHATLNVPAPAPATYCSARTQRCCDHTELGSDRRRRHHRFLHITGGTQLTSTTIKGALAGYSSVAAQITVVKEPLIDLPSTLRRRRANPL